jgi:hypothetical protein
MFTRDGRFLINVAMDEATASPIIVILNWFAPRRAIAQRCPINQPDCPVRTGWQEGH